MSSMPDKSLYALEPLFINTLLNSLYVPQEALVLQPLADSGITQGLRDRKINNLVNLSPFWNAEWNEKAEALDPLSKHFWRQFNNRQMKFDFVIANCILSPRLYRSIIVGALTELDHPPVVACLVPVIFLEPNIPNRKITDAASPAKIILTHPKPKISADGKIATKHVLCWTVYDKDRGKHGTNLIYETAWRSPESLEEVSM